MFGSFTVPRQTPHLYQQIEESRKETESAESMPSRIDMGGVYLGGVNFTFNGTKANSREGIMKVIKEQMPDIADEIAGTIAVNIQRIFANMKLQNA